MKHNIQMVDLTGQYQRLKAPIDKAMDKVLSEGKYINGPEVGDFSTALGRYLDVKYVIPCGNGTDALQAALMALDLEPGDEVITTTFSFVATVEVIALLGLKPVLVDVDPDTFNISPEKVKAAITGKTRAIIPVHLFGQSAAMEPVMQLAEKNGLFIIEDAAQSLGATYNFRGNGKKLGTIGHIGCTSFFPSKNLGCFGDGGACYTNDAALAEKMKMVVNHGSRKKYFNERVGMNSRLDTLQAAVLQEKLEHLDDFIARREDAARVYYRELEGLPFYQLPSVDPKGKHSFNQYTIKVLNGRRDELKQFLEEHGIPSMIYYPSPLHKQPVFRKYLNGETDLKQSENISGQVLSLPMHTELTSEQLMYITEKIRQFL